MPHIEVMKQPKSEDSAIETFSHEHRVISFYYSLHN